MKIDRTHEYYQRLGAYNQRKATKKKRAIYIDLFLIIIFLIGLIALGMWAGYDNAIHPEQWV